MQLEVLAAAPFVLVLALIAGVLQAIPLFALGGVRIAGFSPLSFIVVGSFAIVWWTGGVFLWWVAVHRTRWAIWTTAVQITLGLALGEVLANLLAMAGESIKTGGWLAHQIGRDPWTFLTSNLFLPAIHIPLWFIGALIAVSLGRSLAAGPSPVAPTPLH